MSQQDDSRASRRELLRSVTVGTATTALVGEAGASHDDGEFDPEDRYGTGTTCGYPNPVAGTGFVFPEHHDICAADHPESVRLKEACRYTLDHLYPNATTLAARGYLPYFDVASVGGFSHWIHPDQVNTRGVELDPGRPEGILVDNGSYCAQGVMFLPDAASAGHEPPVYATGTPAAYDNEWVFGRRAQRHDGVESQYTTGSADYRNTRDGQGYFDAHEHRPFDVERFEDHGTICAPWHRHTDAYARFAWWLNRNVYDGAALEDDGTQFWCAVPGMFHVWPGAAEADIGVYAHDSPSAQRTDDTVCRGGYETDDGDGAGLTSGSGDLTLGDLPADLRERAMPDDLRYELEILSDFDDATLYQMTVGEIKDLVRYDG